MAFEGLTDKFNSIFKKLKGHGRLTEKEVTLAVKEVKLALLEADVSFKVVKDFTKKLTEKAVGAEVFNSLTPAQTVIKMVRDEMIEMLGSETTEIKLKDGNEITTLMMLGLQGAGKTTTASKLAAKFKEKGKKPLLVACDIYRPAAIKQLQINGEKLGIEVFSMGTDNSPVDISKAAIEYAKSNNYNIVILDTAGRLHIDDQLMTELENIKKEVNVDSSILVVDAMTGQDAVTVSQTFNDRIGVDGVIVTKLDGDARGGGALSIKAQTGCPILYVGMGEKLSDLEVFHPDRIASRILGMGDLLTLIDKAEANFDKEQAKELEEKIRKSTFGFDDFLEQLKQIKKMGPISELIGMIPGINNSLKNVDLSNINDDVFKNTEAIILSMTPKERANPDLLNPSRKNRIAKGSGVDISEVNKLVKQFDQMKKMMKRLPKGKKRFGGFGGMKFPF